MIQDPAKHKNHKPNHDLTPEYFEQRMMQRPDPHYKTNADDIPRLHDNIIEVASLHPEEEKTYFTDDHRTQAYEAHQSSIKNRAFIEKKALHHAQRQNISEGLSTHEDHTAIYEDSERVSRPPDMPDEDYLRNMFVVIHIRKDYLKDQHGKSSIDGQVISVENALYDEKIYY